VTPAGKTLPESKRRKFRGYFGGKKKAQERRKFNGTPGNKWKKKKAHKGREGTGMKKRVGGNRRTT